MSSASPLRPLKRRRDDIDEKIEALSKVINTVTGSKKSFLQAKFNNIKLKKQKLVALSLCRSHEASNQNLVTEFEMMIAENDIDIEIESIRSSKKFKRIENKYLERLFRDPHARDNRAYISTPNNVSTSCDISAITANSPVNSPHTCSQNMLKTQNKVPMCDKSTNTEPVHILKAAEFIPPVAKRMSSKEASTGIDENISPIKHTPCRKKLRSEGNMSPASLKEITSTAEDNNSQKENLLQPDEYTFLNNSEDSYIQSNWFESSFELEVFLNEKPDATRKAEGAFKDTSASENTEKGYKYKIYRRKTKSLEAEASAKTSRTKMAQNLTVDSTTVPTENMTGNGKIENTKNVSLSKSKIVTLPEAVETLPDVSVALPDATVALPEAKVTLPDVSVPLPEATVALPDATVTLPETTITLPEATIALPEATVTLPEATVTLPEANNSHKLITNLFETYKEIYTSKNVTISKIPHSRQNNSNSKKQPSMNDLKTAPKCNENVAKITNCKENYQNNTEILNQNNKSSQSCKSKDVLSNHSHGYSKLEDSIKNVQSKDSSTKSQEISKYCNPIQMWTTKLQVLSAKYKNLMAVYPDSVPKTQNLSDKKHLAKPKDSPITYEELFTKSQEHRLTENHQSNNETKSLESLLPKNHRPNIQTKSQERLLTENHQPNIQTKSQERLLTENHQPNIQTKSKECLLIENHQPNIQTKSQERLLTENHRPNTQTKSQDMSTSEAYTKSKAKRSSRRRRRSKKRYNIAEEDWSFNGKISKRLSSSSIFDDEKAKLCMNDLVKDSMQNYAVKTIPQEDLVNGLFKDLMASKRFMQRTASSSDKTVNCGECGLVYEGHMCVYTIREILEQC